MWQRQVLPRVSRAACGQPGRAAVPSLTRALLLLPLHSCTLGCRERNRETVARKQGKEKKGLSVVDLDRNQQPGVPVKSGGAAT